MKRHVGMLLLSILAVLYAPLASAEDCEKAKVYYNQAYGLPNDLSNLAAKEQLYKKATELCSSYIEAQNNLGDVYEIQKRFDEAINQYKKAASLLPDSPYPSFGLGDVYFKTGRPREAVIWYEKGLKYDQGDVLAKERLKLAKELSGTSIIKSETIRGVLSAATRGPGEEVSIYFGEGLIPFDYDKSDIRPDAKPQLTEISKALKGVPSVLEIAGHTDVRGPDEYNIKLSDRRARSVVEYLVTNLGIPKDRLIPKGYGKRVNLCISDSSEACHAFNRRVQITKKAGQVPAQAGTVRSLSGGSNGSVLVLETGFFYRKVGDKYLRTLKEDVTLLSRKDSYSVFFRPLQDCHIYILQEDARGVSLLFPKKGEEGQVRKGQDYWVPSFGKAYTLDDTKGEERLYVVVTSWEIKPIIPQAPLTETVKTAARSLTTRTIKVVERPQNAPEQATTEALQSQPQTINALIERVEGEGGWVRVVKFRHE